MRLVDWERREIRSMGEKGEWGWAVDWLNSSWTGMYVPLVTTGQSLDVHLWKMIS